jgi:pilus assembly protein CpaB
MFHLVPATAQTPGNAVGTLEQFDDQIATNFIAKGEPVKGTDVAYPDARFGMAFQVPPGYRAATVAVNPVSGLAGFLKPGNRVDVLATFDTRAGEAVTRTVLQDVVILAYGQQIRAEATTGQQRNDSTESQRQKEAQPQPADTATLLVRPDQSEKLVLAATKARLSLTLRGVREELQWVRTPGVLEHQVTRMPAAPRSTLAPSAPPAPTAPPVAPSRPPVVTVAAAPPKPEPEVRSIIVIRGTRQELVQVPD